MGFLFVFSLVGIVLCVCVLLWGMGSSPKQMLDAWIRQLQQALQAHQNAAGLRQGGLPRELDGELALRRKEWRGQRRNVGETLLPTPVDHRHEQR